MADWYSSLNSFSAIKAATDRANTMSEQLSWLGGVQDKLEMLRANPLSDLIANVHSSIAWATPPTLNFQNASIALAIQKMNAPAIDSFAALLRNQATALNFFGEVQNLTKWHSAVSTSGWLSGVFSNASRSMAATFSAAENWSALSDIEKLIANYSSEDAFSGDAPSHATDDIYELREWISRRFEEIRAQISKVGKDPLSKLVLYLGIIAFLLSIKPTYDSFLSHPETATAAQVERLSKIVEECVSSHMTKEQRKIIRPCQVYSKPNRNAKKVVRLPGSLEVSVLDSASTYLLIRFIDPADGSPCVGWILKKYSVTR